LTAAPAKRRRSAFFDFQTFVDSLIELASVRCLEYDNWSHWMFIAMNRFKVIKGSEAAFESVWLSRDSYLDKVPGFVEFHLLKGPEAEDHTLYASHTVWTSRATFDAWTKSEAFRAAHHKAGENKPLYLGHPQFEGFETIQSVGGGKGRPA
jgi:heme-degrading monooxygenase HmoA